MKNLLTSVALYLILSGCVEVDHPTPAPAVKSDVIMPLQVGNIWNYHYTVINPATKETSFFNQPREISGQYRSGGENWYSNGSGTSYTNRETGLWEWNGTDRPEMTALYPAQRNATFFPSVSSPLKVTVIAVDSSITVPAGTFSCYVYSASDSINDIVRYFSPNVGEVAYDVRFKSEDMKGKTVRSVLTSYSIVKQE